MAGHFILRSITQSDRIMATTFPLVSFSGVAHQQGTARPHGGVFPGWSPASRLALTTALASNPIANRDDLPPHRYLQFPAFGQLNADGQRYASSAGWIDNLIRPTGAGLGLRNLSPAAQLQWNNGNKSAAFVEQCRAGNVSVEIYYMSGYEMS